MRNVTTFGARIRSLRAALDISQTEFGRQIGVNRKSVSEYENDNAYPRLMIVIAMAEELHVSLDWLLLGRGEMWRCDDDES